MTPSRPANAAMIVGMKITAHADRTAHSLTPAISRKLPKHPLVDDRPFEPDAQGDELSGKGVSARYGKTEKAA